MSEKKQPLPDPSEMTESERQKRIRELLAELKSLRSIPRSDWHREFENALQLDVESWANGSWVMREHWLGEDAPRIDFIVVSGDTLPDDVKDVFRRFLHKNVIEFKGPGDKVTPFTIRKVTGYVNFYIATAKPEEDVRVDGVTATIFASEKDDDAFYEMERSGQLKKTDVAGIYLVKGIADIPFQIVMTGELEGEEYAAYRVLRAQVDERDVDYLLDEFKNTTDIKKRDRLRGLLSIVETKHIGMVKEKIKEDREMRDAFTEMLIEVLQPQLDERINERINERVNERINEQVNERVNERVNEQVNTTTRTNLFTYVQNGDMMIENAARNANMTPDQFRAEMEKNGFRVPEVV